MSKELNRLRQENQQLRRANAHLRRLDAERQATIALLQQQLEQFREQLALLKKALFSPRRERFVPAADQQLLFEPESLETTAPDDGEDDASGEPEDDDDAPNSRPAPRRPRRKRFEFPQCLPVKRIEHPLPEEDRLCPCVSVPRSPSPRGIRVSIGQ